MTVTNRAILIACSAIAVSVIGSIFWMGRAITSLRQDVTSDCRDSQQLLSTVIGHIGLLRGELSMVRKDVQGVASERAIDQVSAQEVTDDASDIVLRTDADVVAKIGPLAKARTAEQFANVIGEIDSWLIEPADEAMVRQRVAKLLPALRGLVSAEVTALQEDALKTPKSRDGAKQLDQAGRILALYPMSDDPTVIKEAMRLADRQKEAATRLDALRRQRYNKWAIEQVEKAINYYNENVSRWNPLNDNTALLPPLVRHLGSVDPMYLEPTVLDLYNYIIDKMKNSLSEKNKLEFAKQMTEPNIQRKALGDL